MTDVHSPEVRSKNMRAIRSKDTKPELFVRRALHAAGFRYRLHCKSLPGTPDLVLRKYRTVIFVHGCFFHGHDCKYCKLPATRPEFWAEKINKNRSRDITNLSELRRFGWRTLVIWECALKQARRQRKSDGLVDAVRSWLATEELSGCIAEDDFAAPSSCTKR